MSDAPKCETCHIYPWMTLLLSPLWREQMLLDGWKRVDGGWKCKRCQDEVLRPIRKTGL